MIRLLIGLLLVGFSTFTFAVSFPFNYSATYPVESVYNSSSNTAATCSSLYNSTYQNDCRALPDCKSGLISSFSDSVIYRCMGISGTTRLGSGTYYTYDGKQDKFYMTNISCPANSTFAVETGCTPNAGYSAVNDGSGNWSVVSTGQECTSPKVYNATTGTCDDPLPPEPEPCTVGDSKILATKVTDSLGTYTGASNWDCINGCEYKRVLGEIYECYNLPESTNPEIGYCNVKFVGTGSTCTQGTISFEDTSTEKTPISTAPQQVTDLNNTPTNPATSSPVSSGAPITSSPSSGGGTSPPVTSAPAQPGAQDAAPMVVAAGCDGCATESTQRLVHQALTDVEGFEEHDDPDDPRGSADIAERFVNNGTIQGLFHFQVPAHSSECPTLTLSIPFLRAEPYVLDAQCEIIAPHIQTLRAIATSAWIILAVLMILGA